MCVYLANITFKTEEKKTAQTIVFLSLHLSIYLSFFLSLCISLSHSLHKAEV